MIRMKLSLPIDNGEVRFECREEGCGDIVRSSRIHSHAKNIHHDDEVLVDTSAVSRIERRYPMCSDPRCGHSMWFHNNDGICSKCHTHD